MKQQRNKVNWSSHNSLTEEIQHMQKLNLCILHTYVAIYSVAYYCMALALADIHPRVLTLKIFEAC